jgi:ABC-type glutathione transport system ATPase component
MIAPAGSTAAGGPLLEVEGLVKRYPITRPSPLRRSAQEMRAVDGVSFTLGRGETLGLVGETGCGKSTTARIIAGLLPPTAGTVRFDGEDIAHASRARRRALTREIQMTFQDPYSSLNPRRTAGAIIADPLAVHRVVRGRRERARRVHELMGLVGLDLALEHRQPHELSGGQRQRVGLARALALGPRLLIADEPVSALDLSVQAQILDLLRGLRERLGLTLLLISHDLAVVRSLSDRVAVMQRGRIVELADAPMLYSHPSHPYTRSLLAAVPALVRGEPPDREGATAERGPAASGAVERGAAQPGTAEPRPTEPRPAEPRPAHPVRPGSP